MTLVIDTHMHVYRSKAEGRRAKSLYGIWEYGSGGSPRLSPWDGDEEDALAAMAAADAAYAVVTSLLDPPTTRDAGGELIRFNEWTVDLGARNPTLLPCLAVDPRYLAIEDTVHHIQAMLRRGRVVGIKLHPPMQGLDLADEQLWPLFALCEELELRVVAHSGPSQRGAQLGEPDAFRPLLDAFPGLHLALAHLGGASWRQAASLAADYERVHFDLCEIIEWTGAERAPSRHGIVRLIQDIGVDRVMMGSDFPWYDIAHTSDLVRSLPGLATNDVDAILGGNASRFFGIAV